MTGFLVQKAFRRSLKFRFARFGTKRIGLALVLAGIRVVGLYFHAADKISFIGKYRGRLALVLI